MRKLFVSTILVASMAAGSAALAASTAPSAKVEKASASSTKMASGTSKSSCLKQWKAQKTHSETKKAFLTACEKA